ncbi:hypothetical protein KEU06_08970 [Pseudaminobacter sp. 19-2017]|uniref:Uncharacterized protein n=1 Tax=Pseudaminobacter soli (ex Zhang et al. 2022) TaxID=2831468 RepID=A0A942DW88_9HYPH|nr:hypothetical protein [Pseudaminobacter soli]MBS3648759.1 hypothetical protein [Pseudaminobacter soli]
MTTTDKVLERYRRALIAEARAALTEIIERWGPLQRIVIAGTGGRNFLNLKFLDLSMQPIKSILNPSFITHGNATGADKLLGFWARSNSVGERALPITKADWERFRKAAGPRRNQAILDSQPRPHAVVAMPGGSGTADMVCRSRQQGFPVIDTEEIWNGCLD